MNERIMDHCWKCQSDKDTKYHSGESVDWHIATCNTCGTKVVAKPRRPIIEAKYYDHFCPWCGGSAKFYPHQNKEDARNFGIHCRCCERSFEIHVFELDTFNKPQDPPPRKEYKKKIYEQINFRGIHNDPGEPHKDVVYFSELRIMKAMLECCHKNDRYVATLCLREEQKYDDREFVFSVFDRNTNEVKNYTIGEFLNFIYSTAMERWDSAI